MGIRITTATSVEALKPSGKQTDIPDAKVAGLSIRITPSGAKTWTFRYRDAGGHQKRISFGRYPAVSLADARDSAYKALAEMARGGDPGSLRKAGRAEARAERLTTVSDVFESYFRDAAKGRHRPNGRPKRASTINLDRYYYERFVLPRFGAMPLSMISRRDVQSFLDEVAVSGPSNARHCRNVLRQGYNYAIRRELTEKNPAQMAEILRVGSRERVLSDSELRAIWQVARAPVGRKGLRMSASMGLAACLEMVTLQRGSEVCGLHAREIDWQNRTWTIPGIRTKNHVTHVVPLSNLAIALLEAAFALAGDDTGFAFPSRRAPAGHLTRPALGRAMKRLTAQLGIEDVTPHDFRRTGGTAITSERISMPRFIVSRVLNQISDTGGAAFVTGVYDRNEYLPEKRRALSEWAALLQSIVSPKSATRRNPEPHRIKAD